MTFNEGACVKGTYNNKEVIGYVIFDEDYEPLITGEKCYLSEMTDVQLADANLIQESDMDKNIQDIVNNDFTKLNKKKIMKMKDKEAEKVGAAREKELKKSGVKLQPNQYKDKFVAAQKAVAATGILANELGSSKVLVKYSEDDSEDSNDLTVEQLYGEPEPIQVNSRFSGRPMGTVNADLDAADWSHFRTSNQQATDVVDYTDKTLQSIEDARNKPDEIDYSEYLDDDTDSQSFDILGEDDIENDTINNTNLETYDSPEDDIHIEIENPKDVPITITVGDNEKVLQAQKENEASNEVEEELDKYEPTDDELAVASGNFEEAFVNHLINKYKIVESKKDEWKANKLDLISEAIKEIAKSK